MKDKNGCVREKDKGTNLLPETVVLTLNGQVVPQDEQVQQYLDSEIVGESELAHGCKYIVTHIKGNQNPQLVLLRFEPDGKARIKRIITDFIGQLKDLINEPESRDKINKHCRMDDWKENELQKELFLEFNKGKQDKGLIQGLEAALKEEKARIDPNKSM